MTRNHESYRVADIELADVAAALGEWHWLIGNGCRPLFVSVAGDVFLQDPSGGVARLDTGIGRLEPVAPSVDAFQRALDDPELVSDWFLVPVVDELRAAGNLPGPGECHGFSILPIFREGSYGAENRFVLSALEHLRLTGDMHRQIARMPDGEAVQVEVD